MRGKRNGAPSSPSSSPVERQDERDLDAAYDALSAALKAWRRRPDDPACKEGLMAAYDRREDALEAVIMNDIAAEEAAEARAAASADA